MALEAVGSNPTIHPILLYSNKIIYIGVSPSGKALDFDSSIRRFKSCHPSHEKSVFLLEYAFFVAEVVRCEAA